MRIAFAVGFAVGIAISRIAGLKVILTAVAHGLTEDGIQFGDALFHAVVERAILADTTRQAARMCAARWVERVFLTRGVDLPAPSHTRCGRNVIEAIHVESRHVRLIRAAGTMRRIDATEHRCVENRGRTAWLEECVPRVRVIRIGIKSEKLRATLTDVSNSDFQYAGLRLVRRPGDIDRLIETI